MSYSFFHVPLLRLCSPLRSIFQLPPKVTSFTHFSSHRWFWTLFPPPFYSIFAARFSPAPLFVSPMWLPSPPLPFEPEPFSLPLLPASHSFYLPLLFFFTPLTESLFVAAPFFSAFFFSCRATRAFAFPFSRNSDRVGLSLSFFASALENPSTFLLVGVAFTQAHPL